MNESFFRKLLNSILDRRSRTETLTTIAAFIAGATACAIAVAPMFQTGASVEPVPQVAEISAAPVNNESVYLPSQSKPDAPVVPRGQAQTR